jgi:predicted CxxxxCH...CXXCH cytochrome family protein
MNGPIRLNFDPNDSGAAGTLKAKNGLPQTFTQNTRVNVICSSVYCHSDGYANGAAYGYKTTPNWYGGSYAGDKCAGCHTNSPTGSDAHSAHVVGIHYADIYKGPGSDATGGGFAAAGNTNTSSHGYSATSTTINCNVCHANTVTMSGNDKNTVCAVCHTGANLKGTMMIAPISTAHINGMPDVAFNPIQVLSKAQIRDDITTVSELGNNWTRTSGYKAAGSVDKAVTALNSGVMFNSSSKTCSNIACHNGNSVRWTDSISCESCHTALPQ